MRHSLFRSSFVRAFLSKWYLFSIVATAGACYLSSREYLSEGDINSVYFIDLLIHLGMFKKVMVFFSAIPFVTVYCQDERSGYIKSVLIRCGERSYAWSNLTVCVLSGFSAVFLGIMLYFSVVSCSCPPLSYDTAGIYSSIARNVPVLYVLLIVCVFSLYAAMWSAAGLAFSAILPDHSIALASPLIFGYVLEEITQNLPPYLDLYRLSHGFAVFEGSPFLNFLYTASVFLVIIGAFGCVFSNFSKRRSRNEMV